MFLKALTLKGFKSFAETTTLEMQPGVTVVVGPNGSGKSNVVDAIGWVLGAQAPSAVRSQRMEDVIFAGTTHRPALGRAEVSLTIDNGVGRQQHVIVGQGQIDAVLNARPEDRRLVIEEAAGILKHRKRKERSERRLAATEGNLVRLGALLGEERRQLRPLEPRAELRNEQTLLERRVAELDTAVLAAEARLDTLGGSEVGDALARVEALREKARGQLAVLAERRRGVDRERAAFVDQAVVASLEADSAQLRTDLVAVDHESEALEPDATALAAAEAALADARQGFEHEWADGVPTPSGRAAEVRGELVALRTALARAAGDHERSQSRAAALRSRLERLDRELAGATDEIAAAQAAEPALVAAAEAAGERRAAAEAAVAAAERRRDETQAERHAWVARREALELALDDARARAGAERLATVDGVVGTLLDLIDVDPGWEPAVEAAGADALAAVVAAWVAAGPGALPFRAEGGVAGAVLAAGAGGGWAPAPPAAP